ncbi:hypothetical protein DMUE_3550 [Dictyocoela muelleri]|nr:hypothetical protein DMUE_3550 [Dictyocoela muelleri]
MVSPIYDFEKNRIFILLKNQLIFLIFDDSTDSNGRYILNIIGEIMNKSERSQIYLLYSIELINTNNQTVSNAIVHFMAKLHDGCMDFSKLQLILSDGAPYAGKAVNNLKLLFQFLKHVTCLAHMLHRLCEKIRSISPHSNSISSLLKRILIKNKENQEIFKSSNKLKIPKFLIITRWETWLGFMIEIYNNYDNYLTFIKHFISINFEFNSMLDEFKSEEFISELKEIFQCDFF